ncbi:50S ribosomal protein L19 [Candidatus Daviesbacteria bacterium]|nr:50S ribosomal protein L19 [Candidatus Daviesbacteria bacterium]
MPRKASTKVKGRPKKVIPTQVEDRPIRAGDLVRVHTKIREGGKERVQIFEGVIIAIRGRGENKTMTVRHEARGMGVERIWPLKSPSIVKIELKKYGNFRKSKLYFLRNRPGGMMRLL